MYWVSSSLFKQKCIWASPAVCNLYNSWIQDLSTRENDVEKKKKNKKNKHPEQTECKKREREYILIDEENEHDGKKPRSL